MKFTKRDLKTFILGLVTAFVLAIVFEWGDELNTIRKDAVDGITGQAYEVKD